MTDPTPEKPVNPDVTAVIIRTFEIENHKEATKIGEEELFKILAEQIDYMISYRLEHLFSLLYRMDVKEELVRAALLPGAPEPANVGIARLVLDRQKQRNFTKATIKPSRLDDEWDW